MFVQCSRCRCMTHHAWLLIAVALCMRKYSASRCVKRHSWAFLGGKLQNCTVLRVSLHPSHLADCIAQFAGAPELVHAMSGPGKHSTAASLSVVMAYEAVTCSTASQLRVHTQARNAPDENGSKGWGVGRPRHSQDLENEAADEGWIRGRLGPPLHLPHHCHGLWALRNSIQKDVQSLQD